MTSKVSGAAVILSPSLSPLLSPTLSPSLLGIVSPTPPLVSLSPSPFLYSEGLTQKGRVVINEIGWSGTLASPFDEWIELYNPGNKAIDLSNWVLKSEDDSPKIVFNSGSIIHANDYFLIERSDDNTISNISADLVASFGSGGLNDSGKYLLFQMPMAL